MSSIRLLDDQLINKIAAGEVIERPGSIVKELVENSIDAHSTRISVSIARGGIDRIQVEDNGNGIAAEELELALQRHATSKLTREDELYQLRTMGFRGEALPSIAAISRLSVFTQAADSTAMKAYWEGGELRSIGPSPCPPGTRIVVDDIFFNTPVRRAFLKSPVSEQNHIYDIMLRLALSRPDISFILSSEKKNYFKTPGNGELRDCLISIYGSDYAQQFIPLQWEGEHSRLAGFISKPEFKRSNRKNQIFLVNGRSIRSPLLSRALEVGFQNFLLSKEFASAILFLTMEPGDVDINVHPQKLEVRFRDEQQVFRLVQQAVKAQLEQHVYRLPAPGAINPRPAGGGAARPERYSRPPAGFTGPVSQDASLQFSHPAFRFRSDSALPLNDSGGAGLVAEAAPAGQERASAPTAEEKPKIEDLAILGQLFNTYILAESPDGLWIVDQHAAQERIMFNRLEDRYREHNWEQQLLVPPLVITLEPRSMELVEQNLAELTRLGIELEPLGPVNVALRALPAYFKGQEQSLMEELVQMLKSGEEKSFYHDALARMACKASIRAGDALSRPELYRLLADLLECREYKNCPHGRPLIFQLPRADIVRYFKRA